MAAATEMVIVRHGETDWNRARRIQGHRQIGLNSLGMRQAAAAAAGLAGERFDALYSSDLVRACQTADVIAAVVGQPIIRHPGLREWDLGVLAGETHESALQHLPETFRIYRAALPDAVVPGGESIRRRHSRVIAAMESIAAAHPGRRVLVVTHGGPLDDCYRRATGLPLEAPRDFVLLNAAVSRFWVDMSDGAAVWALKDWGDISHLQGMEVLGSTAGGDGEQRQEPLGW